ncbi:nitric oxide-sensing protein NosP [Azospirillum sp.]|uniref:nitric oxide-sensing protein NosP n=1 Tax=Azospirillum sp. TaxID=34012 RepID=UPI002619E3DC|nr:nitric oxide-sensing protein NosP [Azospirillum sp.]
MVAFTRPRNGLARRHPWSTLAEPESRAEGEAMPEPTATAPPRRGSEIPRAMSQAEDPRVAARELHAGLGGEALELVVVFCAPCLDRAALADALSAEFGAVPVIGCTTAGEIGPFGYISGSLVAVGFPSEDFSVVTALVDHVDRFEIADSTVIARSLLTRRDRALAARAAPMGSEADSFAMLLIDGLSMSEETVVSALHNALIDIPLFGASAGDDLHFEQTFVLHDGVFHANAGVVALFTTTRPFTVFRTQHFVSSDRKMVVTGADPQRRIVTEINAEPAGREYARLVGLEGEPLTPMIFASHPVVVRVGGQYHVRSIQKVNDDESLTFFCAIDEGIVLTVAEGVDPVANFDALMDGIADEVGSPDLVLGCDCILRRLEMEQRQLGAVMSQRLANHRVVGFCAYGEQVNGMHVNQTFTGVAIGARGA